MSKSSFLWVFFLSFITDVFWTFYIIYSGKHAKWAASVFSGLIAFVGSEVVLNYTAHPNLRIPFVLGTMAGTFAAIELSKRLN